MTTTRHDAGRGRFGVRLGFGDPFRQLAVVGRDTDIRNGKWRKAEVNWSAVGPVDAETVGQFAELMQKAYWWAELFDHSDVTKWRAVIEDKGPDGGEATARSYFFSAPSRAFVDSIVETLEENYLMVTDLITVSEFPEG